MTTNPSQPSVPMPATDPAPPPPADDSPAPSTLPKPQPRLRCADRQIVVPAMPLEDLLTPEHHARTVWQFVQGLDLTPLLDTIRAVEGHAGRSATDPKIWRALWRTAP